jgi:ankyrin repeat protein
VPAFSSRSTAHSAIASSFLILTIVSSGETPLHGAANLNHTEMASLLIFNKAEVDARDFIK